MNVLELDYFERLKSDYEKHGSLFVAFDYDNTVFDFHKRGIDYTDISGLLKECKKLRFTLILFTAREGERLNEAINDLSHRGIPFDLVNENQMFKTRKPYYNILLDDRAGLKESYDILRRLVNELLKN